VRAERVLPGGWVLVGQDDAGGPEEVIEAVWA